MRPVCNQARLACAGELEWIDPAAASAACELEKWGHG